jgi:hypothetical protein
MDRAVVERRREPRRTGEPVTTIRARVRPGYPVGLIDLSASGALVIGPRPLKPGSRVDVHLASPEQTASLKALVVWCQISAITPEGGVSYQAGLKFDGRCLLGSASSSHGGYPMPAENALHLQVPGQPLPVGMGTSGAGGEEGAK